MNDIEQDLDQTANPDAMHAFYAKAMYTLRESRKALLRQYGVADEEALLGKITRDEPAGAATYEHYLAARIIEQTRQQLREDLLARMKGEAAENVPEISFHLAFKAILESEYADRLSEQVRMAQDALLFGFDDGLAVELRYAGADAFSLRWMWRDREFRLYTSPVHEGAPGTPFLQVEDGEAEPFTLGDAATGPRAWFTALLDLLLRNPSLAGPGSSVCADCVSHAAG